MNALPDYADCCFFFGTFNPIHLGHLVMAETARTQLGVGKVVFVPAYVPPHRQTDLGMVPFLHRFKMVQLACRGNQAFHVSAIESTLPQPSYTVETLRAIIPGFDSLDQPVPMIIGADALEKLGTWYQPEVMAKHVLFLQAPREQTACVKTVTLNGQTVALRTQVLEMPLIGISSTLIRQRLARKESIRYLTPRVVADYIRWNGLYTQEHPLR